MQPAEPNLALDPSAWQGENSNLFELDYYYFLNSKLNLPHAKS